MKGGLDKHNFSAKSMGWCYQGWHKFPPVSSPSVILVFYLQKFKYPIPLHRYVLEWWYMKFIQRINIIILFQLKIPFLKSKCKPRQWIKIICELLKVIRSGLTTQQDKSTSTILTFIIFQRRIYIFFIWFENIFIVWALCGVLANVRFPNSRQQMYI